MKLYINLHLRRALMACMSIVAITSYTLPSYAALNENNDGVIFADGSKFRDSTYENSSWRSASLIEADFVSCALMQADFSGANLTDAIFNYADLKDADFTDAIIKGVSFYATTNLTQAMLTSTASYTRDKDFSGIQLPSHNLSNFNFTGMNLTNANLISSNLTNANFTDAIITGVNFGRSSQALDQAQFESTANYKQKDFSGISFDGNDLSRMDLSGFNLTGTSFYSTELVDTNFTDAIIKGADFTRAHSFTQAMLASTASYKQKDLTGTYWNNLLWSSFDFTGMDLTGSQFYDTDLKDLVFTDAIIKNVDFRKARNLTFAMISSTASYKQKDLSGTNWGEMSLTNFDFSGMNLTGARFSSANLKDVNLKDAIIKNAYFSSATNLTQAMLKSTASYHTEKDFSGMNLGFLDLGGMDFSEINLTEVNFADTDLTGVVLTDAIIKGASFKNTLGITKDMIESTASFKQKDLWGINFAPDPTNTSAPVIDLSGIDFTDTDLSFTQFRKVDLTGATFKGAVINSASLVGSIGITSSMLKDTANYAQKDFAGVDFTAFSLSDMDFGGTDLRYTNFKSATVKTVSFENADLRGANLYDIHHYTTAAHKNHIGADGVIHNLELSKSSDYLLIRGPHADHTDKDLTAAKIVGGNKSISNGARMTLQGNGQLELQSAAQLTLESTGHLDIELDTSKPSSLTGITLQKGTRLNLEAGSQLNITLAGDLSKGYDFSLISWEDPADAATLIAMMQSGEGFAINGISGTVDAQGLALADDGMSIVLYVEDPTTVIPPTDPTDPTDPLPPTPPVPPAPTRGSYVNLSITPNGTAGGLLLDHVAAQAAAEAAPISLMTTRAVAPAPAPSDPDLAAVLQTLDDIAASTGGKATVESDRLLAAVAGAGVTSLGSAALSSAEGELKSILSRSTGLLPAGKREFWISAQMSNSELDSSGTAAGHSLHSWGGSAGVNWGLKQHINIGIALTALYGELDTESVDAGKGELDSYYLSLAANHQSGMWQHRAALSWGLSEGSLTRRVSHQNGGYNTVGDTDGYSLSLAYEVGYDIMLSERSAVTPLFTATLIHSYLDSYTESGSGAALHVGEQENTIATFGVGARIATTLDMGIQVGARALVKLDLGDRAQDADVSITSHPGGKASVRGTDAGSLALELGYGASMHVGEAGAVFLDASVELRDKQQDCNASVGYRMSF